MRHAGDRTAGQRTPAVWRHPSATLLLCACAAGCGDQSVTAANGGAGGTNDAADGARQWAAWPMPNGPSDVAAGAPNAMTYTTNGDGTVTDAVTHLMWQQAVPTTMYSWTDALAYCGRLTLGGHSDWYLPTEIQLVSIVDDSVLSGPTIDATAFPGTPVGYYWSSDPMAMSPANAWLIDFNTGSAYSAAGTVSDYVRCVREAAPSNSAAPPDRYQVASDTVYDTRTKLTWQRSAPSTELGWNDAKAYCASAGGATLAGTGWRLPTEKELLTLVDYDLAPPGPTIDSQVFPGTASDFYCSESPIADGEPGFWYVDFSTGNATNYADAPTSYVRCVR